VCTCEHMIADIGEIDWNQAWKEVKARRTVRGRDRSFWNKRAPSFAKHAAETTYPEEFIRIMNPESHWSVFDMACGGGTLAVPLAKKVREVTAVDFSEKMLDIVKDKCREEGIANVRTVNARWEDNWEEHHVGMHDVVVASRSLVVDDLQSAILKLDKLARERVYTSTIVGDGPFDRRIFEALDRPLNMGPDYIYNYNLLYQMGIHAHLTFIVEKNNKTFESHEDAANSMRWMLDNLSPEEEDKLRRYLERHLVSREGNWRLDYDRSIKWAVMWWEKKERSTA
jgi:2-polyprenyl-3-methyl-5-hydroxy-6-metoxy-1,4-benzoquinol methylase